MLQHTCWQVSLPHHPHKARTPSRAVTPSSGECLCEGEVHDVRAAHPLVHFRPLLQAGPGPALRPLLPWASLMSSSTRARLWRGACKSCSSLARNPRLG